MIVEAAKLDSMQYTVQYELLRCQVIGAMGNVARESHAGQPRCIGLALLLSEGMPGWLKTMEEVLCASPAPRAVDSSDSPLHEGLPGYSAAPVWLSTVQRHEVTTILASLVLSTRPLSR
jgi:hypothetical protein